MKRTSSYNADGIRISKENHDDDVIYRWEYDLSGMAVIRARYYIDGELTKILLFMYDENGSPFAMSVKDANSGTVKTYYYEKNLQGDIVGIMNEAGYKVVSYTYDAWGNPYTPTYIYHSGVSATDRANVELNPFRYRGYYYDSETGYYYLQTRYYSPELGRFLNADGYINANGDILGYNMFAYCGNNPLMYIDPSGTSVTATFTVMLGFAALAFLAFTTCTMIAMMSTQSIAQQPTTYPDILDKPIDQAQEKEEEKEVEKVKDGKLPSDNSQTYYHITTLENALNIYSTGTMYGSSYEGGRVYAWRMKPDKYAVKNSGAHQGVIISFKTNASFEQDSGIYDPRVTKYGPVVSSRPGPIYVWDVKIVEGY